MLPYNTKAEIDTFRRLTAGGVPADEARRRIERARSIVRKTADRASRYGADEITRADRMARAARAAAFVLEGRGSYA